jgi:hypothetical protein
MRKSLPLVRSTTCRLSRGLAKLLSWDVYYRESPTLFWENLEICFDEDQYSCASKMVMTRFVTAGSDGSGECTVSVES